MPKLFGVDIQKIVHQAIPRGTKGLPALTLRKWTNGVRDPADLGGGTQPTYQDYEAHGVATTYTLHSLPDSVNVQVGDKKVVVIARALDLKGVRPEKEDEMIVAGETLRVVWVSRDPAVATYEVACRG